MAFFKPDEEVSPLSFFAVQFDSLQKKEKKRLGEEHRLPETDLLTGEPAFASVRSGWSLKGLHFLVNIRKTVDRVVFPRIEKGDAVELFIDTRDVKSSGFNTRFCHHFFFLPSPVEGTQCGEITHFRSEDQHPLCDPKRLKLEVSKGAKSYEMAIEIPADILVGFDPNQFNRYGFSYRIHRADGEPQHFSVLSREFQLEEQPSLWARINMV